MVLFVDRNCKKNEDEAVKWSGDCNHGTVSIIIQLKKKKICLFSQFTTIYPRLYVAAARDLKRIACVQSHSQ